jgi:hypothetical protein
MKPHKILSMSVILIAAVASATACTKPGHDFWGNPEPTATPVPEFDATCAAPDADAAQAAFDPAGFDRPPGVRPGNSWIVVGLEVTALSPDGLDGYCVPIAVHLYNRSGEADVIRINSLGVEPGPFDFITTTPFVGRYMALQYDPTEERFQGRPPVYEFHVDATYLQERDLFNTDRPVALRCAITIWGAAVVADITPVAVRSNVSCTFSGNDHWQHF